VNCLRKQEAVLNGLSSSLCRADERTAAQDCGVSVTTIEETPGRGENRKMKVALSTPHDRRGLGNPKGM
jgi:hypothetical protein